MANMVGVGEVYWDAQPSENNIMQYHPTVPGNGSIGSESYLILMNEFGLFTVLVCFLAAVAIQRQRLSLLLSLVKIKMKEIQQQHKHWGGTMKPKLNASTRPRGLELLDFWGGNVCESKGSPRKILYIPIRREQDDEDEFPDPEHVIQPVLYDFQKYKSEQCQLHQNSISYQSQYQQYQKHGLCNDDDEDDKYFSSCEQEQEQDEEDFQIKKGPNKILFLRKNSLNPTLRKSILKRCSPASQLPAEFETSTPVMPTLTRTNLMTHGGTGLLGTGPPYNMRDRQPVDYYPTTITNPTTNTLKKLFHNLSNVKSSQNSTKKKVKFGRTFTIVYKRDTDL